MTASVVIASYIPPKEIGFPHAFLSNLARFKRRFPLLLFSDTADEYKSYGLDIIQMRNPPDIVLHDSKDSPKWPAIPNAIFIAAMQAAQRRRFTHVIYLEEDCRVGCDDWDNVIWQEYERFGNPMAVAGTIVCCHAHCYAGKMAEQHRQLIARNWTKNMPTADRGRNTDPPPIRPNVFPNGAVAVYPVDVIEAMWKISQPENLKIERVRSFAAYDHEIGMFLCHTHKDKVFDHICSLESVFSTYREQVNSSEDRKKMLTTGMQIGERMIKVVAIHPIKEAWEGPERNDIRNNGTKITEASTFVATGGCGEGDGVVTASGGSSSERPLFDARNSGLAGDPRVEQEATNQRSGLHIGILIVTFAQDAWWLTQCLRSIEKFAVGFSGTTVALPDSDQEAFVTHHERFPWVKWHPYSDAPAPMGHLKHDCVKCEADLICPDADAIAHLDSDCVLREPVAPSDYMRDGKLVLLCEPYELLKTAHPGRHAWKATVDHALRVNATHETMCRHPNIFWRETYSMLRTRIEQVHKMSFEEYVLSDKSGARTSFCEFNSLGAYAMLSKSLKEKYYFLDVSKETRPRDKLWQFWSRSSPNEVQKLWDTGTLVEVVPMQIIEELLGPDAPAVENEQLA